MYNYFSFSTPFIPTTGKDDFFEAADLLLKAYSMRRIIDTIAFKNRVFKAFDHVASDLKQKVYAVSFCEYEGALVVNLLMCGVKAKGSLKQGHVRAYCMCYDVPEFSEPGSVFIEQMGNDFIRTA